MNKGFTIIELLLYVSIAALMLLSTSVLLAGILEGRVRSQAVSEVESQGALVMQLITQTIRNAVAVTNPLRGADGPVLTLVMSTSSQNPTVFDLATGTIRITEGVGVPLPLTSSRVVASGLNFSNFASVATPDSIRITFTLRYQNPTGRGEYEYAQMFRGSATRR